MLHSTDQVVYMAYVHIKDNRLLLLPIVLLVTLIYVGVWREEEELVSGGRLLREEELANSGGLLKEDGELASTEGLRKAEGKLVDSVGLRRKEEELASSGVIRKEEGELASSSELRSEGELVSGGELCRCEPQPVEPLWNRTLDFEALQFSNETGNPSGEYLVPNFVHFIHFGGKPLNYVHLICILAAYKNQRPERLYLHYNDNATFTGKYWEVLYNTSGVKDVLRLNRIELPTEIFGQELSEVWRYFHGADIMRIRIIMQYGGIYFDNDVYLVRSLDDFRRFELAIPWEYGKMLGNQVVVAHKDARFLKRWLDGYRKYDKTRYYDNAGKKPTTEVLYKEPHLVHRVQSEIATDFNIMVPLFKNRMAESQLRQYYAFHLLTGWMNRLGNYSPNVPYPKEFNETNVVDYPVTFRDLAIAVYDTAGVDWPKNSSTGR